jgi:adenosylcobinamide kinase / adenosylcobinamide-phosphate guanylyltransferase
MIVLIVGGAKSGKSMLGQHIAKEIESINGKLYYVATMKPFDKEDLKRIENHLLERKDWGFETIEQDKNIENILKYIEKEDTLLIDSLTSLVTNEMFIDNNFVLEVQEKILNEVKLISNKTSNVVIVTDYLFSDSIVYDKYTEAFRRELGKLNREIAEISDVVIECSFNNKIVYKGKDYIGNLL